MKNTELRRALGMEYVGTALLVCVVLGSGIMATNLTQDVGVQLIINAIPVVAFLYIFIRIGYEVSGAHYNPVVSLIAVINRKMSWKVAAGYVLSQMIGARTGALLANAMFHHKIIETSSHARGGSALLLGEVVATAGLIWVILQFGDRVEVVAPTVAAWIFAAYFFTSSTSFANPAVTFGRMFSDSFAGIAPRSFVGFALAQIVGALVGLGLYRGLTKK